MAIIITMSDLFVIHVHSGYGPSHYDLMIQRAGALDTWRLAHRPDELAADTPAAVRKLPPHRLEYLDYEGPVSAGRGAVARYDRGECVRTAAPDGAVMVVFDGCRLHGRYELRPAAGGDKDWTLTRLSDS